MKLVRRLSTAVLLVLALAGTGLLSQAPRQAAGPQTDEAKIVEAMHLIQSQPLYEYVAELVSEKYGGRLTGTEGERAATAYVAAAFRAFGLEPAGGERRVAEVQICRDSSGRCGSTEHSLGRSLVELFKLHRAPSTILVSTSWMRH